MCFVKANYPVSLRIVQCHDLFFDSPLGDETIHMNQPILAMR